MCSPISCFPLPHIVHVIHSTASEKNEKVGLYVVKWTPINASTFGELISNVKSGGCNKRKSYTAVKPPPPPDLLLGENVNNLKHF